MTFESNRPVGRGGAQMRQVIEKIAGRIVRRALSGMEYATAVTQNSIILDRDGYSIYSEEGDFITFERVQFEAGDRLLVSTIGGPKGLVVVLGRWQKSSLIAAKREYPIRVTDETGISTTNPTPDNVSEKVQISRDWLYPQSRIRVIGKLTDSQGAASRITFSVIDATAGTLESFVADGEFDQTITWSEITDGDFNTLEFKIVYSDPTNGIATLSECVLLIGDP